MHGLRRQRLWWIALIGVLLSIALALVLFALKQNISLYYTLDNVAAQVVPRNTSFRVGGLVQQGSVKHLAEGVGTQFVLTDGTHHLQVIYRGLLPDLFKEGQGIVAQGKLNAEQQFIANEVLAKHDEKYMPAVVREQLQARGMLIKNK